MIQYVYFMSNPVGRGVGSLSSAVDGRGRGCRRSSLSVVDC
jgi:hypothetical protein